MAKKSPAKRKKLKNLFRDRIFEFLQNNNAAAFNHKQISSAIDAKSNAERFIVIELLKEEEKKENLKETERGKYIWARKEVAVVIGKIDITRHGAGYLIAENVEGDIPISKKRTGKALHGDKVKTEVFIKNGKSEARVIEVMERALPYYVGKVEVSPKFAFFVADNPKIHVDFFVPIEKLNGAKPQEKVIAEIIDWPDGASSPFAQIKTVLGKAGENETEVHSILAEFGLPYEFPQELEVAAENISDKISSKEIAKRRDYRKITTFTIDPDDAKDFDDALSIEQLKNGNLSIGVHIADVSHYVTPNSAIDKEALNRATSVYLVDRVVPMLPEKLSNGLCSLRPNEEKLTFSAVFEMNENAEIIDTWIGKTVIYSDRRFTYAEAQERIESKEGDYAKEINQINDLAEILRKHRAENGAIEFGGNEVKFELNEAGKPIAIHPKKMGEANWMIEEFMLLANKKVSERIGKVKTGVPKTFLYRVHDLPDEEKLKTLQNFVKQLGYKLENKMGKAAAYAINQLLKSVKGKPEEGVISQLAIRSMAKASYSTNNIGHYGLAFDHYSHFTSPIRRYPDLIAHRLLHHYLEGGDSKDLETIERFCKHCSLMERKAVEAERTSIKYKQVEFMEDQVGEVFNGIVSGVTRWGLFVELEDTKIEGMVSVRAMNDDHYYYDEEKIQLVGRKYKKAYTVGDKVTIEVSDVNLQKRLIDFELVV